MARLVGRALVQDAPGIGVDHQHRALARGMCGGRHYVPRYRQRGRQRHDA
jgi:hypothetical protein